MGRHFSESEVTAMGRNKNEDKNLKQRLSRLKEEKTFSYDSFAKEKKKVMDLMKENRRTSGNTLVGADEKSISEDSFKDVLLSRRPWSCTPHETTFNVIFREASDPGLLKATYRLKDKGNKGLSRRTSAKSVPNDTRSFAVSRQSTRSEPTFRRPRTCVPSEVRKANEMLKKPEQISDFSKKSWKGNNIQAVARTDQAFQKLRPPTAWNESENLNQSTINNTTFADEKQIVEQPSSKQLEDESTLQLFKPSIEIPTIFIETSGVIDDSMRPKSRLKKRLSILEPTIDNISENEHSLTKIYELDKVKHVNDILNGNSIVELPTDENESNYGLRDLNNEQPPQNGLEKDNAQALSSNVEDNSTNLPIERQISRPSIAFGESLDVVDFSSIHFSEPGEDYILYKGRPIHNYVKPQLRYKYDPFAAKSRERLIQKLTTDIPVVLKDESNPIKHHRVYSKGARTRMLKHLVDDNNSPNKGVLHNPENDKLESKIQEFYDSVSEFCRQNTAN